MKKFAFKVIFVKIFLYLKVFGSNLTHYINIQRTVCSKQLSLSPSTYIHIFFIVSPFPQIFKAGFHKSVFTVYEVFFFQFLRSEKNCPLRPTHISLMSTADIYGDAYSTNAHRSFFFFLDFAVKMIWNHINIPQGCWSSQQERSLSVGFYFLRDTVDATAGRVSRYPWPPSLNKTEIASKLVLQRSVMFCW